MELYLELQDEKWPLEYIDHDRHIVRAVVYDQDGYFYFVRARRDDEFGKAELIETSGGGVEVGEELKDALKRELKEELGVEVNIITKLGVISDYYNLIHRHNINNYYLCEIISFGDTNLTKDEIESFHISTLKLTFNQAMEEYKRLSCTSVGQLIANREIPILEHVKTVMKL